MIIHGIRTSLCDFIKKTVSGAMDVFIFIGIKYDGGDSAIPTTSTSKQTRCLRMRKITLIQSMSACVLFLRYEFVISGKLSSLDLLGNAVVGYYCSSGFLDYRHFKNY
jgi:hypothetical protein